MAKNTDQHDDAEQQTGADKHATDGATSSSGTEASKDQSEKGGQIAQDREQTTGQGGMS